MMDAISNGLKQGLNDSDKDVSVQAMRVLSLFSLLDETKADRLIAKMSTSTRKLFDSKYGASDIGKRGKKGKSMNGVKPGRRSKSPKKGTKANGKGKKKPSAKSRRGGSGKGLFKMKEDPIDDGKKGKGGTKGGKGKKKPSTKDKGGKGRTKSPKKGKDRDGSKSPRKGGKGKTDKEKNGTTKPKKKTEIPPLDTKNGATDDRDNDNKVEEVDYALNGVGEEEETTEVDMDKVRNARKKRRGGGKKQRSTGTFDGGNDVGIGFDVSALGGILDGHGGSDSGSDPDEDGDDGDDRDDKDGDDKPNGSEMNAGMNGDARKEDNDDYSSSTETYEGDNDIEIYEFPQKEALNNNKSPDSADFNIDIDRYLSNNNPEYNWKFGNEEMIFFSHKHNTHLLMSRISQIKKDEDEDKEINYEDEQMS
eukprot:CAMPEP_0201595508 /NCGR_PEP_ID=MMETSP0190_2-20130828/192491_1 /ASSEMBLY_ACC=CAM_ASM_000263 /TAXON_ID=37353 /ORGANISM="Rosalina sp." /LENGTH=419 /DNA_ID=CAMNT_0048055525 /DNA_START=107 /DNA_END=1362 /DNA_ORIENTATION=+